MIKARQINYLYSLIEDAKIKWRKNYEIVSLKRDEKLDLRQIGVK